MKITVTAAVMAVIMLVMSVSVYALSHRWYRTSAIASGTQILKGGLQVNKSSDNSEFTRVYATLRYDPSGTAGPGAGYRELDLRIDVEGFGPESRTVSTYYYDRAIGSRVAEGDYISTYNRDIEDNYDIDTLECIYSVRIPNSTNYFIDIQLNVDVNTPSE